MQTFRKYVTCSSRFKGWWQRCARHYGSALMEDEGRRYGMLWYAYRTGWRHAREAEHIFRYNPEARKSRESAPR